MHFFNYVMRKVWLHQTRIGLSLYDVAGLGYLRESVCFLSLWDMMLEFLNSLIMYVHVICSFRALLLLFGCREGYLSGLQRFHFIIMQRFFADMIHYLTLPYLIFAKQATQC